MAMTAQQKINLSGRVPFGALRQCAYCGRPALANDTLCQRHAGAGGPKGPGMAERRLLMRWDYRLLIPRELIEHPAYAALLPLPVAVRCPMRVAMVQAWESRHREPLAWHALVKRAHKLAETIAAPTRKIGYPWWAIAAW